MDHAIREFRQADLPEVMASWENAFRSAHPFLTRAFLEKERHNIPHLYLPTVETWVAEWNGRVIGFISLLGHEVRGLFVEPVFQGMGMGRALMDKAQELYGELEVEVFEGNTIGRRFYSRYGFEPLSECVHKETGSKMLRLQLKVNR